jgi:Asp-tRNA(Asn)/Glu-tRNA(Gln) amidotransferase A subunit family amidase
MPAWAWVLIVVAALAIVAVVTVKALRDHRSKTLRERFGPEYDRTLETGESKRDAEAELAARAERRDKLEIRPLPTAARDRYLGEWQSVQARFVDDPEGAVRDADMLIQSVMRDRGYPMDDFEQRAADVSVDHPQVVKNYRQGHKLARASALGEGTTEDLRQAMQHYRSLFDELVEQTTDAPLSRDDTAVERVRDEEAVR